MTDSIKSLFVNHAKKDRHFLRYFLAQIKYRSWNLHGSPIFFANSFPKSGTHLLTQIMEGLPEVGPAVNSGLPAMVMYAGATGRERSVTEISSGLKSLFGGDISYGHLHALPEVKSFLAGDRFCTFFILRDPRDVVVSHVHYVTDMEPNHVHHDYYSRILTSFDQRLTTSILGRPDAQNLFPDIAGRFAPFLGWLDEKNVLTLKYEDLISDPAGEITHILNHAVNRGFHLDEPIEEATKKLLAKINPQKSPTFRQGKSGGWKKHFSPEISKCFKDTAGELLIRLGYEKNNDW